MCVCVCVCVEYLCVHSCSNSISAALHVMKCKCLLQFETKTTAGINESVDVQLFISD